MSRDFQGLPKELLAPHPVLRLPDRETVKSWLARGEAGRAHLEKVLRDRAELIHLERYNPLEHGFEPETYKKARELLQDADELLLNGANREGKTNFAAKFSVEHLVETPDRIAAFLHSSERSSKDQQQPVIFSMLPPEIRALGLRGVRSKRGTYIQYTRANGFTGEKFILPNTSMGLFFNYKQDVGVMEGYRLTLVWFDELVPLAFLDALTFRLAQGERLIILITFTPVRGYTPVVARYVAGAKVIETRPAALLPPDVVHVKGCPKGHMPYVLQPRRPRSKVLFFHWGQNPYGASKEVQKKLEGANSQIVKMRAYGWADKLVSSAFPKFGQAHIITRKRFNEEISKGAGTWYCATDPRPGKNWFIKWYFVSPVWGPIVHREWPDARRYGEWALPPAEASDDDVARKNDWRPGPAQRLEAGRGLSAYKALILETEGWRYDTEKEIWVHDAGDYGAGVERVHRRVMDPRFAGSEVPSQEEGQTIIEMLAEKGHRDSQGRIIPAMEWEAAPASAVLGAGSALEMIVDAMDYDEKADVTPFNCPHWYVVEDCEHSILAYTEFSTAGTPRNALKDVIDPDRYFIKSDCDYVEPNSMQVRGGGHW